MTDELRRPTKMRADQLLVEQGIVETRSRAQALILAGEVFHGDRPVNKAGEQLKSDSLLRVREQQKFVSRGGLKLEGALLDFGFDVTGLVAADIGASTGGFTDCLLQRGAARIFAVDVGHGQLAEKLRQDARVISLERTNARHLTAADLGEEVDLTVVDASFIALAKLLPALFAITRPGGHLLALIKPQFEVGRDLATRTAGVIRDPVVRAEAVQRVLDEVSRAGFSLEMETPCRIKGPKGNLEHFALAERPLLPEEPLHSVASRSVIESPSGG